MIPVNRPLVYSKNNKEIEKSLGLRWISGDGPIVKKFEKKFSEIIGSKFAVTVSNGTAALEVALAALKLKPGSKVIVPNLTIISCLNAILRNNLEPVFVDVNKNDFNICILDLKKKINKNIKAMIMVHTYGLPSNIKEIMLLKKKFNFKIIEDCAEGLGLKYKNKFLGRYGDLSIFSFYSNKLITTGEGGMISVNNKKLYEKCKSLRNLCFGKINRFNHDDIGWDYRMTNIQASLGLSQIKNINKVIKKKMTIGKRYYLNLLQNENIKMLPPSSAHSKNIYWVVGIVIKNKKILASDLAKKLNKLGIMTRPFFWPMHEQDIFKKMKIFKKYNFPNSSYLARYGLYLPSYYSLKNSEIDYISRIVNNLLI